MESSHPCYGTKKRPPGNIIVMSVGRLERHRMGEAERQFERLALEVRAVADALDLQAPLEAVGDALDHVGDQAPGEPVEGTVLAAVGGTVDGQGAVLDRHLHVAVDVLAELALRALDADRAGPDVDLDAIGDLDWLSSDSAHQLFLTRRARRPPRRRPSDAPHAPSSRRGRWT